MLNQLELVQGSDNEAQGRPPSVVDRYFKKRFKTDNLKNAGEDQAILTHSNRVCVICLAESHPIISEGKSVAKVSFEDEGWSRMNNKFSGKSKRGAQWLEGTSPLCKVTCDDGTVYTLYCCIKGQLIEINENLLSQPDILNKKPYGEGYLAVMLPGLKGFEKEMQGLKSEEEYKATVLNRAQTS